jgi:hypothetical protein
VLANKLKLPAEGTSLLERGCCACFESTGNHLKTQTKKLTDETRYDKIFIKKL